MVDVFVDPCCPFSLKIFLKLLQVHDWAEGRAEGELCIRVFLYPQPWHPQSTMLVEAIVAVQRVDETVTVPFMTKLFETITDFYDASTYNKSRQEIYQELSEIAKVFISQEEFLKQVEFQVIDDQKNSGNLCTQDVKWLVKYGRSCGVHVTPTCFLNNIEAGHVSSGWELAEWQDLLDSYLSSSMVNVSTPSSVPLPVIVICGEAGSGKTTLSNELVDHHGFVLVDGDLVHNSPPWSDFSSMHVLCQKFIEEESFMRATVDTIVDEVEKTLVKALSLSTPPSAVVLPFVMYTQASRVFLSQRLLQKPELISAVTFVWLRVDEVVHQQRNEDRVEKWAAVGITQHPNDIVNMTKRLTENESLEDCVVIDNSRQDQIDQTVHRIVQLAAITAT